MSIIQLSRGQVTIVDIDDYAYLCQWNWCYSSGGYAVKSRSKYGKEPASSDGSTIKMHNVIMPDDKIVDHINRNGLDNRRSNLRYVTHSQNMWNRSKHVNNTSGFVGVTLRKVTEKWEASIQAHGKRKHLGEFNTPEEASTVYQAAKALRDALQ
jgi:hypothetical protein